MGTREVILGKFAALSREARAILDGCGWEGREYRDHFPPDTEYLRLRTEALNIVRRACGDQSDHYRELRRLAEHKDSAANSYYLPQVLGIVEAAHRDFEAGLLFDLRALVQAEILGDFLDQAEYLVGEGYHVPAASLAGAVLEDGLRKLCDSHGIAIPPNTKIDRLNAELAKAAVYDKLVQKRITALADVRNNADHGHFQKFNRDDVEDMVKWLKRFAADYLR